MDKKSPLSDRRYRRLSTRGPVILFVVVLVLAATLAVLWHVTLVHDYNKMRHLAQAETFHWSLIALGSVLFLAILILSSILGSQLIGHIRWSQRQANFIASVSHELNSPLSSIKLFAQTLRQPEISSQDRLNFVGKILFDVERLQRLIANILRAAEVDNHEELPVAPRRLDLRAYLAEHMEDARTLYAKNNLDIALEGTEDEVWVHLDAMMFHQVLDNLIDNAIRYRGEGEPRVRIRLTTQPGSAMVAVSDEGLGVPAEELPHVFDRFYRAAEHEGRPGRKGTGIGLFVVRSIVEGHGGRVEARSAGPGQGMTVAIRLPLISAIPEPAGTTNPVAQLEPNTAG